MFIQIYHIWKKIKHFWKQRWWYGKTLNKLDFFIEKKFNEAFVEDEELYNETLKKELQYNEKKYAEEEYNTKKSYLKLKANVLEEKEPKLDILNNEVEKELVSNIKLKLSGEEIETTKDFPKVLYTTVGIIDIDDKDFRRLKLKKRIDEQEEWISSFNKMQRYLNKEKIPYNIIVRDITLDYDSPIFKTEIKIDEVKYENILENYSNFLTQLGKSKKKIIHVDDFLKVFTENYIPIYKTFLTKGIAWFDNFQITLRNNIPIDIKELNFIRSKFKGIFDISVFNASQLRLANIRGETDRSVEYRINDKLIRLPWKVSMRHPIFCKSISREGKLGKDITKNINYWYLKKLLIENNFTTENSIWYGFLNSNLFFKEVLGYYYDNIILNHKAFELLSLFYPCSPWKIKSLFFQGKDLNDLEYDYYSKIDDFIKDKKERTAFRTTMNKIYKNTKQDFSKIINFLDRFYYSKDVNKIFYAFYTAEQENRKDFKELTLKEKNNFRNIYNYQTNVKDNNFKTFGLKKINANGVNYVNATLEKNENIQQWKNIFLYDFYFTMLNGLKNSEFNLDKKKIKLKSLQEMIRTLQEKPSVDEAFFKLGYSVLNSYLFLFLKSWNKEKITKLLLKLKPLLLNNKNLSEKDFKSFEKSCKEKKYHKFKVFDSLNETFFLEQVEKFLNKETKKEEIIEQCKMLKEKETLSKVLSNYQLDYKKYNKTKITLLEKIKKNFETNYKRGNRFNTIRYTMYYIKFVSNRFWIPAQELLSEFENMFYTELKIYDKEHWDYDNLTSIIT